MQQFFMSEEHDEMEHAIHALTNKIRTMKNGKEKNAAIDKRNKLIDKLHFIKVDGKLIDKRHLSY